MGRAVVIVEPIHLARREFEGPGDERRHLAPRHALIGTVFGELATGCDAQLGQSDDVGLMEVVVVVPERPGIVAIERCAQAEGGVEVRIRVDEVAVGPVQLEMKM